MSQSRSTVGGGFFAPGSFLPQSMFSPMPPPYLSPYPPFFYPPVSGPMAPGMTPAPAMAAMPGMANAENQEELRAAYLKSQTQLSKAYLHVHKEQLVEMKRLIGRYELSVDEQIAEVEKKIEELDQNETERSSRAAPKKRSARKSTE